MAFINKIGNILKETSQKLPSLQSSFPNTSIYQAIRCFSSSKLFIGGLSFATDENSLREAFAPYGDVIEARIIFDRESGSSRGFGFISYPSAEEASAAIQALDGRDLHGRFIKVAYATDQRRTNRGPSFSGAAGYGGSFRGSDGYGTVTSHNGGNFSDGDNHYRDGYKSYGNTGYGSTGAYTNRNYRNPNFSRCQGFPADGNGGSVYTAQNGLNSPGDSLSTEDVSNGPGGGQYIHNAGDNFGGNPGGYGAASGGDSYGTTGNFSTNGYSNGNADTCNTTYDGANGFNDQRPYSSVSQDNGYWQHHNLDTNANFNDQDEARARMNDNSYANSRYR